jgi:nucleotide-binding universal stress UspA family protein
VEPIVVGVDGSAGSLAALRWGLAEAKLRGAPLRLVHAYELPRLLLADTGLAAPAVAVASLATEDIERVRAAVESEARRVVDAALEQIDSEANDGIDIGREVIEGPTVQVLIEAGRGAALLVVGSRGRGGFAGLLLGSVSQQCAQHPPCPVVILPPVEEDDPAGSG